jgi:O-antigen/teichoic acid export membrane protein
MRSVSVSTTAAASPSGAAAGSSLTAGESSFRNPKPRTRGVAALVGYKIVADVAGKGSLFAITIVAARRLTPEDFGVFALGTTIGWMLSVGADFGVQMHLARTVARTPGAAAALLRRWARVRIVATAGLLLLLGGVLAAAPIDRAIAIPLALFAVAYAALGLVEFLNYFYRGLSRSDIESTTTLLLRATTLALAVGVLIVRPTIVGLALAMLAPAVAALIGSAIVAGRFAPIQDAAAPAERTHADRFVRDVFPIGAGIVLSSLYFRIDILLVERWAGLEAVAGYNAVFRLIDALRLVPAAVLAVTLPALCNAIDRRPLRRVALPLALFGSAAAAMLWPAAKPIVTLAFGSAYATAAPAFRILALALPLLSINFALTHQLVAWNRQRAYAGVCAAALAINLALNAWLIPAWSIDGAAWATLATEACVTAGCAAALVKGPA